LILQVVAAAAGFFPVRFMFFREEYSAGTLLAETLMKQATDD
jgi:hypothetical protein